jgi:predicted nucleic acid-binding Zn ribbon protein
MPVYCYEDRHGQVFDFFYPVGKAPRTITDKAHGVLNRCFSAESASVPAKCGYPIECYASGVHPDQAGELRKCLSDAGVQTEVSRDGNPIYRDARHRKRALKARGMFDRAAYC